MKSIPIKPVTRFLDLRSNPEEVEMGGYRWVLNWTVQQKLRLCRMSGWRRFLDRDEGYDNQDFHNHLTSITGDEGGRKPITFLMETASASKSKILLLGNDRTVFALMLGTGQWRVLNMTPMGVDDVTRWYGTQSGEIVVLTNDFDVPQWWPFDGADMAPIDDLVELGISRVGVVATWLDVVFYANITEQGTTKTFKILWSDMNKPLSLIPSDDSIAGSLELNTDESILAMKPLGNVLIVYTTRRIWQLGFSGLVTGGNAFSAAVRYDPQSGEACLAYKNTLVSTGEEHLYGAAEGIYSYTLFREKPTLVEYINRASSYIYDTLDRGQCDWFIGEYNSARREIYLSWRDQGLDLPTTTLVINTQFPFTGIVDHGFTAFETFQPNEPVQTLAEWILEQCICDSEEYAEVFGHPENEGEPCVEPDPVVCDDPPDAFFTTVTQELEDGIVMEDWNEAEPSENSLCNRLAGTTIASLCADIARRDQCNDGKVFVMASAGDLCLKELTDSFYREVCTNFTGCGTYTTVGYKSILRTGPMNFRDVANEKHLTRWLVEAIAAAALVPGQMSFRVGVSSQALDPNDESCGIRWFTEDPQSLDCIAVAGETHEEDATRPDAELSFNTEAIGKWLYIELVVENPDATPADVGAIICISSFAADV